MKRKVPIEFVDDQLNQRLVKTGLRFTAQRRHVFGILLEKRDHPSAEEVFIRAKHEMPEISMATVYNCLDTLVKCGLVREVNHDRGATRYCSNMRKHHHFYCDECGGAYDIDPAPDDNEPQVRIPAGFSVRGYEIAFRGLCPECASNRLRSEKGEKGSAA